MLLLCIHRLFPFLHSKRIPVPDITSFFHPNHCNVINCMDNFADSRTSQLQGLYDFYLQSYTEIAELYLYPYYSQISNLEFRINYQSLLYLLPTYPMNWFFNQLTLPKRSCPYALLKKHLNPYIHSLYFISSNCKKPTALYKLNRAINL